MFYWSYMLTYILKFNFRYKKLNKSILINIRRNWNIRRVNLGFKIIWILNFYHSNPKLIKTTFNNNFYNFGFIDIAYILM